jgi:DNA-binding NarL/FixJ family response regulator
VDRRSPRACSTRLGTPAVAAPPPFPSLTAREREILDLLAAGMPTADIGRRLGLSQTTVRNHVSTLLAKLQVPDRTAAILTARRAGLGRSS